MIDVRDYLTTAEAATLLDVTASRVRQLILAGTLRSIKLAGAHFIERAAIEAYLERAA